MAARKLPPEIIEHIILLSLPVLSFPRFPERNERLLVYSLVSPVWLVAAQAELHRELWIADKEMEERLWNKVGARNGLKELRTKNLWCGRKPESTEVMQVYNAHFVDRALTYCPNIKKVSLSALGLSSFDFSAFDTLEELHCSYIELYGTGPPHILPRPPTPLSSLVTLTLTSPYLDGGSFGPWRNLLNPSVLPSLRNLTVTLDEEDEHQDEQEDERSLVDAIAGLGSILHSLTFLSNEYLGEQLCDRMEKFTSLRHLHIHALGEWSFDLKIPKFPSTLEKLQLATLSDMLAIEQMATFAEDLVQTIRPNRRLKILAMSKSYTRQILTQGNMRDATPQVEPLFLAPLRAAMEARGGQLELFEDVSHRPAEYLDSDDEWSD